MKTPLTVLTIVCFLITGSNYVFGQDILSLPNTSLIIAQTKNSAFPHLVGLTIDPKNALNFDFIIHKGAVPLSELEKRAEYKELVKYFLASLAIPDENQWVNLSPYEHGRIIKDDFGKTEMGRDLLAQDYLLKQITASLLHPDSPIGKRFWSRIYEKAYAKYGTTNIPFNAFNKVWIVPDKAVVYEKGHSAFIVESHLKVMLEEDYLALSKNGVSVSKNKTTSISTQIAREIILPAMEQEVNQGQNFANLRQIVSAMILATWYKKALKQSLLAKIYADQVKIKGVDQDARNNEIIYQKYVQAFKKGAFNFIRDDYDQYSAQMIPRKYFSGGIVHPKVQITQDEAMYSKVMSVVKSGELDSASVHFEFARGILRNAKEQAKAQGDEEMIRRINMSLAWFDLSPEKYPRHFARVIDLWYERNHNNKQEYPDLMVQDMEDAFVRIIYRPDPDVDLEPDFDLEPEMDNDVVEDGVSLEEEMMDTMADYYGSGEIKHYKGDLEYALDRLRHLVGLDGGSTIMHGGIRIGSLKTSVTNKELWDAANDMYFRHKAYRKRLQNNMGKANKLGRAQQTNEVPEFENGVITRIQFNDKMFTRLETKISNLYSMSLMQINLSGFKHGASNEDQVKLIEAIRTGKPIAVAISSFELTPSDNGDPEYELDVLLDSISRLGGVIGEQLHDSSIEVVLKEIFKNAFYWGNSMNLNVPIYFWVDPSGKKIVIYDLKLGETSDQYLQKLARSNHRLIGRNGAGNEIARQGWVYQGPVNVLDKNGNVIGAVVSVDKDNAQAVLDNGGIDLNAAQMSMQIKRDGSGIELPVNQQDIDNIHFDGLVPQVVSIRSVFSIPDLQ